MGCDYRMQSGVGLIPQDASMACCAAQFPLAAVTGASMNATQGLYPGMYAPAVITGIKGQPVIFDLVATDFDQCVELEIQVCVRIPACPVQKVDRNGRRCPVSCRVVLFRE